MTHEEFSRHVEVEGSTDRSFGFVFTIFFAVFACLPLLAGGNIRIWSLVLSVFILAVTLARPGLLHFPNVLWGKLGLLLSRIVSPVVIAIIFFFVVTPLALLFRVLGKDSMRRNPQAVPSFWLERRPPGPPADSMADQF
ncbi:MAG TPA: SxtJ family membrane protein [Bryobacteraceae bacterium]|nr:SxtJ family membrane protein [Bryobacteraceae bacterium]